MWRQAPNLTSNPRFLPGWFGWLLWWCKLNQLWIYILPKQAASIIFSLTFSFSSKFLPTVSPGWRWAISKRTVHNCSSRKGMFSSQTFSSRRFYREKRRRNTDKSVRWGGMEAGWRQTCYCAYNDFWAMVLCFPSHSFLPVFLLLPLQV